MPATSASPQTCSLSQAIGELIRTVRSQGGATPSAVINQLLDVLPAVMSGTRGLQRIELLEGIREVLPRSQAAYECLRRAYMQGLQDETIAPGGASPFPLRLLEAYQKCIDGHPDAALPMAQSLVAENFIHPVAQELFANLSWMSGDRETADQTYQMLAASHSWPAALSRTGDLWLRQLEADAPLPTAGTLPATGVQAVIAVSADATYATRYIPGFLQSLQDQGLPSGYIVHVHLINAPDPGAFARDWQRIGLPVALSYETAALPPAQTELIEGVSEPRTYFACARYRILADLLAHYRCPIWVADADLSLLRHASALDSLAAPGSDIAYLPLSYAWAGPALGCMLSLSAYFPTVSALRFARLLRAYIENRLQAGHAGWGLDQAAFSIVLDYCRRTDPGIRTTYLSDEIIRPAGSETPRTLFITHVGSLQPCGPAT